ncbi:MAG: DNA mismatch repair protein MutS [Acidobacteriota bacterium]
MSTSSRTAQRPPKLTPMLRQYLEVKAGYPDALLFYRMGDFYELFYDDAVEAAPLLEVSLTARHKGTDKEVPMCGVPHHALETYLAKVLQLGRKVAICDQVEDPAQSKGLVKREVTRVVTPGTLSQPALLDGKDVSLLAAVAWSGADRSDGGTGAAGFLDVSTGDFFVRRWPSADQAVEDLGVTRPREVLVDLDDVPEALGRWIEGEIDCVTPFDDDRWLDRRRAAEVLQDHFGTTTLRGFGLEPGEPAIEAAAGALAYARGTQFSDLSHVATLSVRASETFLALDATTLTNLDVFRNGRDAGARAATLVATVDRTVSPGGGRRLRDWLRRPLRRPSEIAERHDAVEELVDAPRLREELRASLAQVADPERLLSRAVLGTLQPREAAALRDGLRRVPGILDAIAPCRAELLADLAQVEPLDELLERLETSLLEEPGVSLAKGGVIAEGLDAELDRARSLARDSKRHILELQTRERETTGISSLKIRYNKVFGYYVEVTKANLDRVPAHYVRKQTLVSAERFITPEIKELEEQILVAEERQLALEQEYFDEVRRAIVAEGLGLRELGDALATLDVVAAFAEQAARRGYCRPKMRPEGAPVVVRDGRHPVVEAASADAFVPNDVDLGSPEPGDDGGPARAPIVVLTGPNMGGKSTYLRQVALLVLMAQAGSFVPAERAEIGVVDRIFTRVGASDDLARGESTFMVEMIETANILHHATEHSLVILDEVGRGTSTFDGMSLAWAIVEHLHEHGRPKTLFATHYHELTELAAVLPGVVNRTLAVKEWQGQIVFLRRVVPGAADQSYGLHVARLAGLPDAVVDRAGEVLANLERQEYDPTGTPRRAEGEHKPASAEPDLQLALFTPAEQVVGQILRDTDLELLTPIAALNLLHSLQQRLS